MKRFVIKHDIFTNGVFNPRYYALVKMTFSFRKWHNLGNLALRFLCMKYAVQIYMYISHMLMIWSTRDITPLSRVCASQRTSGTISVPGHCTNIPSYTSSPTESDLGWPTLTSKAVTVTPLEEWCAGHKLLTIGSKALIIHKRNI
jgi:hypothetical protein